MSSAIKTRRRDFNNVMICREERIADVERMKMMMTNENSFSVKMVKVSCLRVPSIIQSRAILTFLVFKNMLRLLRCLVTVA